MLETSGRVLLVGGTDPIGAAGLQMDLKVLAALGGEGFCVVSCVTSQNSDGFYHSELVSPSVFKSQLDALKGEYQASAIKIGLLYDPVQIKILADYIRETGFLGPVIWDPVMGATSSEGLLWGDKTFEAYREYLWPYITLVTPNSDELAAMLAGDFLDLGAAFAKEYAKNVLVKGGHSPRKSQDRLIMSEPWMDLQISSLEKPYNYRGTGCFLASSAAYYMSLGYLVQDAVILGKASLDKAMLGAKKLGPSFVLKPSFLTPQDELPKVLPSQFGRLPIGAFAPMEEEVGVYVIVSCFDELQKLTGSLVQTVQIRIKDEGLSLEDKRAEYQKCISWAKENNCRLFINDDWQSAIELGCYGVHLGQEDLMTADLEKINQAGLRLGLSTHCYYEALIAHSIKPSYMALGPIFETTCKSMAFGPLGIDKAGVWAKTFAGSKIVAIGGLKPEYIAPLKKKGVSGVAVISDVLQDRDPLERARFWVSSWQKAHR